MDRRSFFRTSATWAIGALIGGWAGLQYASFQEKREEDEAKRMMKYSECHENMLDTFSRSFAELRKWEILFFDEEGTFIEKFALPKDWDTYGVEQKQKKRDEYRKQLALKYKLSSSDESDILASSPHGVLQGEWTGETLRTLTKKLWYKKTIGDEKNRIRIDYIRDTFRDFGGWWLIAKLMSEHICGLVAGESRFDTSLISRSGAVGIFQLMPARIRDSRLNPKKYSLDEVTLSLKKQAEIAKRLFLADWELIRSRFGEKIGKAYFGGNADDTLRYVLFPLLINAYNTGYPNIEAVVRGFMTKYPTIWDLEAEFEVKYRDGFGYDFFWYLSRFGLAHNGAPSYGSDSAAYFYKSMAMSRVLNSWSPSLRTTQYIPLSERSYEVVQSLWNTISSGVLTWIVAGWVAWVIASQIPVGSLLAGWKEKLPAIQAPKIQIQTRRRALLALGGLSALWLGGWWVSRLYDRFHLRRPETPLGRGWNLASFEPQRWAPESVLGSIYPRNSKVEHIPVDRRHQPKTITPWLHEHAIKLGISSANTRSDLMKLGGRLDPSLTNLDYRPRDMGKSALQESGAKSVGSRNHPDYLSIHRHTEKLIRDISQTLNIELQKAYGLDPKKYRVRLIVNSGARDRAYAKRYLRNASDNSSHPYGIAFDIAHRFDIIDLESKQSYMITSGDTYEKTKRVLDIVVSRMQHGSWRFQGKFFAIQELQPPHIHISDRLGEEKWRPPYLRG